MTLDHQQAAALELMQSGENVFLTGSAGTGKSTVVAAFLGSSMRPVDVCATTGIAALNLRDQFASKSGKILNVTTVYRWAGIGLGPKLDQSNESFWKWWKQPMDQRKMRVFHRIRQAECVIIDEISMLPGRILSYLDFHMRAIREDDRPFGGAQIICVGDFLQLPPVDKENRGYDWAFASDAWIAADFAPAVLTIVHRQDEKEFIDLLNAFRMGVIDLKAAITLRHRVSLLPSAEVPRLFTHNAAVDKWNSTQLMGCEGESSFYKARITGDIETQRTWLINNLVTPQNLELRVGAKVMITANLTSPEGTLLASNGTLAHVTDCGDSAVTVQTDDNQTLRLSPHSWAFDAQDEFSAKFFQYPLRLAWATTIHKSQGLTLPAAFIDIASARDPGQAYVAISRVRTLAGVHLKAVVQGVFVSPVAIAFQKSLSPVIQTQPVHLY